MPVATGCSSTLSKVCGRSCPGSGGATANGGVRLTINAVYVAVITRLIKNGHPCGQPFKHQIVA